MLTHEPRLQLVASQDIADYHVVGALITGACSTFRQNPALANDDLMGIQQTLDHAAAHYP